MTDLDQIAIAHGTDKGSRSDGPLSAKGYTATYERLLGKQRTKPITLLEIGVWKGASLRMWSDWMPKATIIGVDRRPCTGNVGRAIQVKADQGDTDAMAAIGRRFSPIDVVVDDGSHVHADQVVSFQALRPHVHGLYVIEDLHATPETVSWLARSDLDVDFENFLAVIRL